MVDLGQEETKPNDARFFLTYAMLEGGALILAVLAFMFWHDDIKLLIGSVVLIMLIGSTFLLPRVLMISKKNKSAD